MHARTVQWRVDEATAWGLGFAAYRDPSLRVLRTSPQLLALGALVLIALLLQVDLSSSDVQYLSRPMALPNDGLLVGFELSSTRTHAGDDLGVVLYGRHLRGAPVLVTPSGTAPRIEPTPSLERHRLDPAGLERQRRLVHVPAKTQPGSLSLRVRGTAVSFGHIEVVR